MPDKRADYDRIASTYDRRYKVNQLEGIATALLALARDLGAKRILEVACGTGRWLADLQTITSEVYGLDLSIGMLRQALQREKPFYLACSRASRLPFAGAIFDLIYCVNAIHQFDYPRAFVSEARRLLRPGGALAVVGMDPHTGRDDWYVCQYFEGTYEAGMRRHPSWGTVLDWLLADGFDRAEWYLVERVVDHKVGREILDDPFLRKSASSTLALLTDEAYAAGLGRIKAALAEAEATGRKIVFPVDISFGILVGRVEENRN